MAAQAKYFAVYEGPFWRESGLSGSAVSHRGPLMEIVDQSDEARAQWALFGFLGLPAAQHAALGEAALQQAILAQLRRLFGEEAGEPVSTVLMDWSRERFTATDTDLASGGGHPPYGESALAGSWYDGRLVFASAEASSVHGGLVEGALMAGDRAARLLTRG
jgi:monoamine oxidase